MINENSYPQFDTLFGAYLNQDSDMWGDTLAEVVVCFKKDSTPRQLEATLVEIDKFKEEASINLDKIFHEAYGFDFNPISWGYSSTNDFFEDLKKILTA
ncbi:hypothetical protein LJ656_01260 [Paraburkholderia sp. MMS20-SJTR3]|uniref:CdiI immunity protein domain-containing protein n=1 Tax=Paraburkholderia sejongensis TaxID=2886946 RepID=A0ABS8JMT3_9BURK|nr:contact-dependent growth inhibition system immunity protein [Paraburkholderia sp. MMS20-SJTR3]MCC8391202.1 hypothetical protein [Paraburkholderia sp. MMS20-SJTR3]